MNDWNLKSENASWSSDLAPVIAALVAQQYSKSAYNLSKSSLFKHRPFYKYKKKTFFFAEIFIFCLPFYN